MMAKITANRARSVRGRSVTVRSRLRAHPVPDAAHRLDGVAVEGSIDLVAEVTDVHVDDVRRAVVREVPDVLEQVRTREHRAGVAHEHLEERELLRAQLDLDTVSRHSVLRWIQPQI